MFFSLVSLFLGFGFIYIFKEVCKEIDISLLLCIVYNSKNIFKNMIFIIGEIVK